MADTPDDPKAGRNLAVQPQWMKVGAKLLDLAFQDKIDRAVRAATSDIEGTIRFAVGFLVGLILVGLPSAFLVPSLPAITVSILALLTLAFSALSGIAFSTFPRLRSLYDVHVSEAHRRIEASKRSLYEILDANQRLRAQAELHGTATAGFWAEINARTLRAYAAHHEVLLAVAEYTPALRLVLAQAELAHRALPAGVEPAEPSARHDSEQPPREDPGEAKGPARQP